MAELSVLVSVAVHCSAVVVARVASKATWLFAAILCTVVFAVKALCVFGIGQKARADVIDPWVGAFVLMARGLLLLGRQVLTNTTRQFQPP